MSGNISDERKLVYYLGTGLTALGFVSFISVFITAALHFGDFSNFESNARSGGLRAVGGMICMIIGGFIRVIGARGLAGSGVILDPEQARADLKPYSRMAGGIVKDTLDEAQIHLGGSAPECVVMIKCPACGKLNPENAKFCQECGNAL